MENKIKRFLSLLLAFVMVLGMFPMGHAHVHAAEVELTPDAPEAGKTYVICFKAGNGDYYAMTSTYAAKNNHGTLLTEKFTGTYNEAIGWNLVAADDNGGYYLNAADDGYGLSLNGTISNDAFANANHPAEIMTLEPDGDGYLIKNPSNRYVNALGAVAGSNSWGACGNWTSGSTVYFFALPEVSVNLTVGETYKVSGVENALNVTDNEFVDVKSDFVQGTVKSYQFADTIEEGTYVILNTRSGRWLLNSSVEGAKKLQSAAGHPDLGNNAYLWNVTEASDENMYYLSDANGNNLNLPGHEQAELVNDENATVRITTSPLYAYAWEIYDTNTYMNDLGSNVGSYTGKEDGGSQWVFYKVVDVPACTYAGAAELPSDATITSGNEYLLVNIRNGNKTLLNKQHPSANACLYLNGTANATSIDAVWTITEHEGSYYIQDQNGKYLTFSSSAATVTFEPTPVSIGWQGFGSHGEAWAITRTVNNRKEYMSNPGGGSTNRGGGWHEENDGGSRWDIYTTSTTPVGTYDVTVTAKAVGETTIRIGGTVYTFHVTTDHVHEYKSSVKVEATCSVEGILVWTCSCEHSYEQNIGLASDVHKNTEIQNAKDATLTEEGYTGDTYCKDCEKTIATGEIIPVLGAMNAKIGQTVYALTDCEFTYTADQKLFHPIYGDQGLYLFMNSQSGNRGKAPISATNSEVVTVNHVYADGSVELASPYGDGINCLHYYSQKVSGKYGWDRCSAHMDAIHADGTHSVYLYTVAEVFDADSAIPGYTKVTTLEVGKSYLIVGVDKDGDMFVMRPTTSSSTSEYIAQLVAEDVNHPHNYVGSVTTDATCTTEGVESFRCDCGRSYTAVIPVNAEAHSWSGWTVETPSTCIALGTEIRVCAHNDEHIERRDLTEYAAHTPGTPVEENRTEATCGQAGSYDLVIKCTVVGCNHEFSRETKTIDPTGEHTYSHAFDTTCNVCPATREAKASVVGDKIINTTAEASSYHSGEAAYDKRPGSAVDGNYNTFWATDEDRSLSLKDAWLVVDLGSEQLINQAVITRRVHSGSYKTTGAMLDYIIEVSSDKETWTKVASGDIDSTGNDWTIPGATVTFDAIEARYVRLTATKTFGWDEASKNWVMSCAEFEIFKAVCAECTENEAVLEKQADGSYKSVVYCADCGREIDSEDVIVVETFDVKLEAEIKLEYTVSIPASIAEGAYVTMTKEGGYGIETETIAIDNSERIHQFAMGIASGEMTAPITIRVYNADGTELELYTKSGKLEGTATKTVLDYAKKALGEGSAKDDTTKALVRAMLVYGGYAQAYFQENFQESVAQIPFADMNIDTTLNVDVAALAEYKNSQTLKDAAGVKASSITTSVDSYTAVRVYLTVYEGQIGDYTFTLTTPNGTKEITPVLDGNRYYVDIPDIASGYIDYKYTITITNKETAAEVNVITASVLGYVRSVLNNSESSDAKKDLVKALYLYNQAADANWPNR